MGTILGTVHYMAPEQVEGREADARSDIWALGVVLYEMLTGARPFGGDSAASVIGAILKDTPRPISDRQPLTPALDRAIRRCIEKDPDDRWQSARDVMFELESASDATGSSQRASPRSRVSIVIAAASVGLLCGGAGMWLVARSMAARSADAPVIQHAARVTHESAFSEWPTWSPDGRFFAFSSNRGGDFEIYVRRLENGQDINVTNNPMDDVQPTFSPDGTSIVFVSTRSSGTGLIKTGSLLGFNTRTFGGDIWITPTLGGQARRLAADGNFRCGTRMAAR